MPRREYLGRSSTLYFRSKRDIDDWEHAAEKAGMSLSKYILEMAEQGRANKGIQKQAPGDLAQLRKELGKLRDEKHLLELQREKYEAELMKLRHRAFLDPNHQGASTYSEELVRLLKSGGVWPGHEILKGLHIPPEDAEAVQIVLAQLRGFESYGLVHESVGGWKWIF